MLEVSALGHVSILSRGRLTQDEMKHVVLAGQWVPVEGFHRSAFINVMLTLRIWNNSAPPAGAQAGSAIVKAAVGLWPAGEAQGPGP